MVRLRWEIEVTEKQRLGRNATGEFLDSLQQDMTVNVSVDGCWRGEDLTQERMDVLFSHA